LSRYPDHFIRHGCPSSTCVRRSVSWVCIPLRRPKRPQSTSWSVFKSVSCTERTVPDKPFQPRSTNIANYRKSSNSQEKNASEVSLFHGVANIPAKLILDSLNGQSNMAACTRSSWVLVPQPCSQINASSNNPSTKIQISTAIDHHHSSPTISLLAVTTCSSCSMGTYGGVSGN
jgi:hypothetical protein